LIRMSIHRGGRRRTTALGVGNLCRPNKAGVPMQSASYVGAETPHSAGFESR
jgi:hypothetical protein